jgi:hypothetical protein
MEPATAGPQAVSPAGCRVDVGIAWDGEVVTAPLCLLAAQRRVNHGIRRRPVVDKNTNGRRARQVPLIDAIRDVVQRRIDLAGGDPDAHLFAGSRRVTSECSPELLTARRRRGQVVDYACHQRRAAPTLRSCHLPELEYGGMNATSSVDRIARRNRL